MITVKRLSKWNDIERYRRHGWLYRGHENIKWDLQTSLERACNRLGVPAISRHKVEERTLREFKRGYHRFTSHIPEKGAVLEWLSIMQHHGAPTRLLDFTYSIYVAAYFAVEKADKDCAIWALDATWAYKASQRNFLANGRSKEMVEKLEQPFMEEDDHIVHKLYEMRPYARAALPSNPFRLNERLKTQQGAFLIPGDISRSFMSNLTSLQGVDDSKNIVKIIIPKSERLKALQALWSMGLSRAVLFPGIDGYAQSLGVYNSLFNPTPYGNDSTPLIGKKRTHP